MNAFEKRPLALGAAVFLLTSALLFSCSANLKLSIAVSCAAVAAVLLIMSGIKSGGLYETLRPIKGALLLCLCAVMLSSLISLFCVSREYDEVSVYIGNECFVRGYVTDTVYESSYGGYYKVQLTEIDGSEVPFGALLDLGFSAGLEAGDIFSAEVSFDELDDDGYFEEKSYYSKDGIIASLLCEDDAVFSVVGTKEGITYQMIALRSKISAILEVMTERAGEGEGAYGIPEALLVGDRSNLDDTVYRDFKYIGASHLLAISGLHFSVLIGGFEAIIKRMGAGRRGRALLIIAASIFYMAFSGFSSSVLRAGIMMIIYSLSYFSRREPDRITSLFVSGALIVAVSPYSAADTGLLLSVTAMLGVVLSDEIFQGGRVGRFFSRLYKKGGMLRALSRPLKYIYSSFAVSASALICTLPVMWIKLGTVSIISPLSTLLLSLPITAILYLCPLIVLTFGWLTPVSTAFSYFVVLLCRITVSISSALSNISSATITLPNGSWIYLIAPAAIGVLLALALICKRGHGRYYAGAAFLCFAVFVSGMIVFRTVTSSPFVTYINIGSNDALAASDGEISVICDISDGSWSPASSAAAELSDEGCSRIDAYIITHLHTRYARTVERLLSRQYVDTVYIPAPETESETSIYKKILNAAERSGANVITYERGDTITVGNLTVDTIVYTEISRSTHPCVALSIKTPSELFAYVGSSLHESELYDYVLDMCRDADTVIFGAHGPVYKSGALYETNAANIIFANTEVSELLLEYNSYASFEIYE